MNKNILLISSKILLVFFFFREEIFKTTLIISECVMIHVCKGFFFCHLATCQDLIGEFLNAGLRDDIKSLFDIE